MIEFGQPLAFWSAIALGLPILAHMAYRQITDKKRFSTLRFLRVSSIPRTGRRRPSDWVLLLVRCALFCLIVLLLADPYFKSASMVAPSNEKSCLIVLDRSPSMSGWGGWEEARSKIVEELQLPSTQFGLLTFGGGEMIEYSMGTPVDLLLASVQSLRPGFDSGNGQSLFSRIADLFAARDGEKEVLLISDFQESNWQGVYSNLAAKGIAVRIFPVGHDAQSPQSRIGNRAVVETKVVPVGADKLRIWAVIRNWDTKPVETQVSLYAGPDLKNMQTVRLPSVGAVQVQFVIPVADYAKATVQLEGSDNLAIDNNRTVWLTPPPAKKFGFWLPPESADEDFQEMTYLGTALESAGDGGWNRWEVDAALAAELRMSTEPTELSLLAILGCSDWMTEGTQIEAVHRFLEEGGVVLLTPGNSPVRMNQTLRDSSLVNYTFARFARTSFRMAPFRIDTLTDESRLSEVFSGDSSRDLYLSQIRKFWVFKDYESELSVPLRDREGHPLVLCKEFSSGGRLVLFSFRLLPNWTDLPVRNSFLPLLVELCGFGQSFESDTSRVRLEVGDVLGEGDDLFVAQEPGLSKKGSKWVEVVLPLVESMPEVFTVSEISEQIRGLSSNTSAEEEKVSHIGKDRDSFLWAWIAGAIFIFLLLENMLAKPSIKNRENDSLLHA
jgi:hypothetical protein